MVHLPAIRWLAAVSVLGFGLLGWGQARARAPVIRLGLLRDRQFGAIAVMAIAASMALYGTAYVIPSSWSASRATTHCNRAGSSCCRGYR